MRWLKPYKLAAAKDRLFKTRDTIERLGRTMNITVTNTYHGMRPRAGADCRLREPAGRREGSAT